MMTSNLTFILNEEKANQVGLAKLGETLSYSKEDVELHFFTLAVIADKHPELEKRNQAFRYLVKQDKLQHILDNLIARHQELVSASNTVLATDILEQDELTQQIHQLEQELDIFNELHFKVKRTYIRFTNEHFQTGWGQSYMVA